MSIFDLSPCTMVVRDAKMAGKNYEYIYIREIIYLRGDRSILEEENSSMNDFRKRKVDAGNT